jgi:hypothetical protein
MSSIAGRFALVALASGGAIGCGPTLRDIPIESAQRRVVSLDGNGGRICGTFDDGAAFCGPHELPLPYPALNAKHTGRALQAQGDAARTCVRFESGDVWCDAPSMKRGLVDRPGGVRYQSLVVGNGFACASDDGGMVDCWGDVSQHRGELLEVPAGDEPKAARRKGPRSEWKRATSAVFRVHGFAGVSELEGNVGRLCGIQGGSVLCAVISSRAETRSFGFDDGVEPFADDALPPELGPDSPGFLLEEPVETELSHVTSIGSYASFGCAVDEAHKVSCFGFGAPDLAPRSVHEFERKSLGDPVTMIARELSGAAAIEMAPDHGCALSTAEGPRADPRSIVAETNKADEKAGQLWCWGAGEHGQLGHPVNARSSLPVRVQGLEDVEAFAVAPQVSCAVSRGELYCWGSVPELPALEHVEEDPCRAVGFVCVPHRVALPTIDRVQPALDTP